MNNDTGWLLIRGDVVLGDLFPYDSYGPWTYCKFTPAPAFKDYRALFDQEALLADAASTDNEWSEWEEIYRQIEALGLRFVSKPHEAQHISTFLLHIDGGEAWFRGDIER